METRKRLEIIIESMAQRRACTILEEVGVTGYTVFYALAGYGRGQRWSRDTDISDASDMVMIVSISDEATINSACERLMKLLSRQMGVLSVSDVAVMRPEQF